MKVTLEQSHESSLHQTVSIAVRSDDLNITEMVELLKQALLAYGYHPDTVREAFDVDRQD